ncbi:MAG: mechanosensitive ion channel [Rhodospirillaceae bacterium]|jgi:small conductance mechanosensitive channel|nr:mechanosensitive ion channel [Rhodospirillaceae bacterium]MBT6084994.1 mechanosensitive ion channel [Rhodospirillaceae bacterium]MBT7251021.1 mechanosensitive ion channel [Rhodospirillaceae bacterium]
MENQVRDAIELMIDTMTTYGLDVVGAILILIIGWWFAGRGKAWTQKAMIRTGKIDPMISGFLSNMVRYVIIIVTVLAVLDRFGVETTSFVAIIGAAGLAIGLALQGALSNVAAGVMLLFFRPFKVGDFIEGAGQIGVVKDVSLFVTHIKTGDNVEVIIPNTHLWGAAIKNYSFNPTRRVDLVFGIGYDDDIDKAMSVLGDVIGADERAHKDPEPVIVVGELGASSVDIITRVWCDGGDYWNVRWDLLKNVKQRFDAEGISIPYPQRDVHLYEEDAD